MAHEHQERYSSLVLAKMRAENILKDGIIFNNDYEGDPVSGAVKVPVRDDEVKVGDNDRGIVWMALGDWSSKDYGGSADCPVEVNTTKEDTFFDPKGPNVIAYGKFVTDHDMGWTKIEIPLEYVSTSRRPTHIIVSCAASMLGDYFTGSPDSIMWIDDIRLEY